MRSTVTGLHHVTALAGDAQPNVDFYAGILGLRLVKRTINFDAPDVHHLYYGDELGSPGSIMTFFPYEGLARGRRGKGQLTVTMFSIAEGSIDHWMRRLEKWKVPFKPPQVRFGDEVFISFEDPDGLGLELVANRADEREGNGKGPVAREHSIKGFHGITLSEDRPEITAGLLTEHLDHKAVGEASDRFRFSTTGSPGTIVDIVCSPSEMRGLAGSGTVHHVAFSTPDTTAQSALRDRLLSAGLQVSPVMDRQYFRSIYFREPGGVLFEVATVPPGFSVDEPAESLGSKLKLPSWIEPQRSRIEKALSPVAFDRSKYTD